MSMNFSFFCQELPAIDEFGTRAEVYLGCDDRSSTHHSGLILEAIMDDTFKHLRIRPPSKLHDKIHTLKKKKCISEDYAKLLSLDKMKDLRNEAAHAKGRVIFDDALWMLLSVFVLAKWSYCAFYGGEYGHGFILPKNCSTKINQSTQKLLDAVAEPSKVHMQKGFFKLSKVHTKNEFVELQNKLVKPQKVHMQESTTSGWGQWLSALSITAVAGTYLFFMIRRALNVAKAHPIPQVLLDYAENSQTTAPD